MQTYLHHIAYMIDTEVSQVGHGGCAVYCGKFMCLILRQFDEHAEQYCRTCRELAEMSGKARSRRQPPKSKASKGNNKGFGS